MRIFPTRLSGTVAALAFSCMMAPALFASDKGATITDQPVAKTICEGDTVSLSVKAIPTNTGTKLKYQWFDNDGPVSDGDADGNGSIIEGSNSATLTFKNIRITDGGFSKSYYVVVDVDPSNPKFEAVPSDNASIEVLQGATITTPLANTEECEGTPVTLNVAATGLNPRFFWYKDNVLIPGVDPSVTSYTTAPTGYTGRYKVEVRSDCGTVTSEADVTAIAAPTITGITPNGTVIIDKGSNISLTVAATGNDLTYEWYKDGVLIPGQTSATFTDVVGNDVKAKTGKYHVIVRNKCGNPSVSADVEFITGVDDIQNDGYALMLNTPNPVLDASTIRFTVPTQQHARLVVTDVTGREVAVLFDGMASGMMSARFDSSNFPAGVYFYTLTSGSFRATQSLSVVK